MKHIIKFSEVAVYVFSAVTLGLVIYSIFTKGINWDIVKPISYGLGIIYIPSKWKESLKIYIGTKGFFAKDFMIEWDNLADVKWDRDIGQRLWGVSFYKKNSIVANKIYIERISKPEFEEEFNKSFDNYKIQSKIS
jgi:hypothetical protein